MPAAAAFREERDGNQLVVLRSPSDDLAVAFAPGVGMVGCSLRHRGDELLGQRGGLAAYAQRGSTFGIPLLAPWANRLDGLEYAAAGRSVRLDPDRTPLRLDPNGLPIHGLLAACPYWQVGEESGSGEVDSARLTASLDFGAHEDLLAGFPFPHRLELAVELRDGELGLATTVAAGDSGPVPVSFGWHPYLQLPDLERSRWEVTLPVRRQARLDDRGVPTGEWEAVEPFRGPLGERTYDDLFEAPPAGAAFRLEGGGRRVEMSFGEGFPFAQVYAPPDQDVVCFEPMTAPTNALVSGDGLAVVGPGGTYTARFTIAVG